MSIRKGTIALFISTILRNLLSFGAIAYFTRSVGVAALGSFFLFQSLLSLLSVPADLGIRVGVEKRLSEGKAAGPILGTALVFKLGLFGVISVGILLASAPIASYIGVDVAPLLVIGLLLNELGTLGKQTLRGEKRVSKTAFFEPVRTAVWAVLGGVLIEFGAGQMALLLAYTVALLTVALIAGWRVDSPVGRPSLTHLRSLIGYSKFAAVGSVGGLVYNWADVVIIGVFLTQTAVGAYEVAWRVATASLLLSTAVRTSIFPQANEWGAAGQTSRLESLTESALIPSLYFVIPAFVGVLILGDDILRLVFAVSYPGIALVLAILMVEKLQRAVLLVLIAPMHAVGRVDAAAYTTLIGVVVNIALNLALIPYYGVVGAAIGTAGGALANTLSHAFILSRHIDIAIPIRTIGWCGVAAAIMGISLWEVTQSIAVDELVTLAVLVVFSGTIYLVVTVASPAIREELVKNGQTILN